MKIKLDRIIIRDFYFFDDKDYYEYASLDTVGTNAGWRPHPNIRYTRRIIGAHASGGETFAIELISEKKMIGTISMYHETLRKKVDAYEIGFTLNPKYEKNGYIHEALMATIKYLFENKNAEILMSGHFVGNIKSENVLTRAGFIYEGTFRKYRRLYNGIMYDAKMYSITKEDYERNKENGTRY